jgi:hypothetical protein
MESSMTAGRFRGAARRLALGLAVAAMAAGAVAGCGSPAEIIDPDAYALISVNAEPLPAPYPDPFLYPQGLTPHNSALRVSAGTLSLQSGGTLTMTLTMRCASSLPAGTECEVAGDGRNVYAGSYAVTEDFIEIEGRQ